MKKTMTLVAICAALVCMYMIPTLNASEAPADMVLAMPEGQTATKAPVDFSHAAHGDLDCVDCHHKWDGAAEVTKCSSEGCHTNYTAKKGADSFYAAFHTRSNEASCLGCHAALKTAGEATGPTGCADCHPAE